MLQTLTGRRHPDSLEPCSDAGADDIRLGWRWETSSLPRMRDTPGHPLKLVADGFLSAVWTQRGTQRGSIEHASHAPLGTAARPEPAAADGVPPQGGGGSLKDGRQRDDLQGGGSGPVV